ncbi:DNA excision repair protein ERCC-6-like [Synchiropus splendidus]|uniref:DNA excision repair protein ERCC-6-like n=1 Tax=Synchiropus splendidus TaxID=270530 RepID=UPI00237EE003|nr:DNA excision repair protein ERCC-6-like [Synchiropus splendidus]
MEGSHPDGVVEAISERLEKSLSMETEDNMETYQRFIQEGKEAARQGDLSRGLELFKLAYDIHKSEKLENRIKKIEELLANNSEDEAEEFVNVNDCGLMVYKDLHDKLYDYQRNGLAFLYSLYKDSRKGGILADDMGLGKTIQVIAFLSGMYDAEHINHTVLVMPTSLITNWTKEFAKWTPGMRVKEFHGSSKAERTRNLEKVQRRGGVIITTYTMLISNWQQLASYHGREFTWDYMILDEAHKIKNTTTKTAKSASAIPSKNRVLLTGTPVQNNLREMWALFDFACQGTLLGTAKTFKTEYENPITRARERDATPGEKVLGSRMSENLMAIIKPYFLRRTKAEVQKTKMNARHQVTEENGNDNQRASEQLNNSGAEMPTLKRKNDLIVWTYLSSVQEDIYRQFLSLDHIKELLLTTRSPLAELTILKKLCDHPRLLSARAIASLGLEDHGAENHQGDESDSHSIANIPDDTLISESGKLTFLFALLERLREEGHRTLVFAHYRKVLDILERILGRRGFKVLRLDGTILQIAERERRISLFQTDESYSVFLLTTQVGGVGITLTAANRVVIYDPSWNPATDAQAVDRAYRIGQKENVVIYRLITCGTVEEKIYRRQIFKDSLIRQNTGDKKNPFRYFSKQELKELFTLEDTKSSSTQLQLQAMHSRHRRTDPQLDEHIAHLHAMEMFGISDHDLMFSLDNKNEETPEDNEAQNYIEGRVQKAQELMKAESELQKQLAEALASSSEPTWLRQSESNKSERADEKRKKPNGSPALPPSDRHTHDPIVVNLDQSVSSQDSDQVIVSHGVVDLTVDDCVMEEKPSIQDHQVEPNVEPPQTVKHEESLMAVDVSPVDLVEESVVMTHEDDNSIYSTADNGVDLQTSTFDSNPVSPAAPLQNKRLSQLQKNESIYADASSEVSGGPESFGGNFNLELEESDMFSEHNDLDQKESEDREVEEEEKRLLSQLLLEESFDVDKSLSEHQRHVDIQQSLHEQQAASIVGSMNDSIITTKKKKAAIIYDSEEEDEDAGEGEKEEDVGQADFTRSCFDNSLLGASTPKSALSSSTPLRSRKSFGGNTSVASRRSLIHSIIEDIDNANMDDENTAGTHSTEPEEDDIIGLTNDESEEPSGETLNSEEEGSDDGDDHDDDDDDDDDDYEEEEGHTVSTNEDTNGEMEESSSEPELGSSERMDQYTVDPGVKTNGLKLNGVNSSSHSTDSYDSLVAKGRENFSQGKLAEALELFLRAIDINPGDPEIQLMTIQIYRNLSQKS